MSPSKKSLDNIFNSMILDLYTTFYEGMLVPSFHIYNQYQAIGGARGITQRVSTSYQDTKRSISNYASQQKNRAYESASATTQRIAAYSRSKALELTATVGLLIGEAENPEILEQRLIEYDRAQKAQELKDQQIIQRQNSQHHPRQNKSWKNHSRTQHSTSNALEQDTPTRELTKKQRATLVLDLQNLEDLNKSEIAMWILLRIEDTGVSVDKVSNGIKLLEMLANHSGVTTLDEAAKITQISTEQAIADVNHFIRKLTGDQNLATTVTGLLISNSNNATGLAEVTGESSSLAEESTSAQISSESIEIIESFARKSEINPVLIRSFCGLNEQNQTVMRSESFARRIELFKTFEALGCLPSTYPELLRENLAFSNYRKCAHQLTQALNNRAPELRENSPLRSISSRTNMLNILEHYPMARSETIEFIDNLFKLDQLGVYGTERLLHKVAHDDVDVVKGLYNEATVALKLKKDPRYKDAAFTLSATDVSPNIKDLDLRIETAEATFLIEIKNTATFASSQRSTAQLTRLCKAARAKRHALGRDYIPVCLITKTGDDINELINDRSEDAKLKGFYEVILAHEKTDDHFKIWNNNGDEVNKRIKAALRGLRVREEEAA